MSRTRTDELVRRYRAVDRANPRIDRPRVEAALRRHFEAAGYSAFPIRWCSGLNEARARVARADFPSSFVRGATRRLDPIRWPPAMTCATQRLGLLESSMLVPRRVLRAAWTALDRVLLADEPFRGIPSEGWMEDPRSASMGGAWILCCGSARLPVFEPLIEAFEAGLWVYWVLLDEVVALPLPALRAREGRLHAEVGPAVSWPGGEEGYFLDGVRVSRDLVMEFDRLSAAEIQAHGNVEVRRVLIRRFGAERFLRDLGARVMARDGFGELLHVELPGDEPLAMVRVLNATPEPDGARRTYFIRVPPGLRSAREAVAWTFRMSGADYAPEVET